MSHYIYIEKEDASNRIASHLRNIKYYKDPVFLCIGSTVIIGDSLGPIVGTALYDMIGDSAPVYGTRKNPVHAKNIKEIIPTIKTDHPDKLIVVVDASLGVGKTPDPYIRIYDGPITPGAGVGKNLGEVGDVSITGIVGNTRAHLWEARPDIITKMGMIIVDGIINWHSSYLVRKIKE